MLRTLAITGKSTGPKNMVTNRGGLAELTMLDVANLLKRPMILLDLPVLVMELEKRRTTKRRPCLVIIGLIPGIMAAIPALFILETVEKLLIT